jgi:sugar transferase (PEP-CTERM system associated)
MVSPDSDSESPHHGPDRTRHRLRIGECVIVTIDVASGAPAGDKCMASGLTRCTRFWHENRCGIGVPHGEPCIAMNWTKSKTLECGPVDGPYFPQAQGLGDRMIRFFRQQAVNWLFLMAVCELAVLVASVFVAVYLRYVAHPNPLIAYEDHLWLHFARASCFAVVIFLGMGALGLYQAHMRETWFGVISRQAVAFGLGSVALLVFYYVVPEARLGRGVLGLALLVAFVAVALFRTLFLRIVDVDALKRRVLVLGAGKRAATIFEKMRRRSDRRGFSIVGYVANNGETAMVPQELIVTLTGTLVDYAEAERIDEIVVGPDERRGGLPMEQLLDCRQAGISITELVTFFERESGKVKLGLAEPSWLVFSQGFDMTPLRLLSKRTFDIVAASAVLLMTWFVMLLVALAIVIESGWGQPILYRQERVGERGKVFKLIKFRSMRTDAEHDGVARWASKSDDRVTRVGRFIRRARLDELPQLWNVLRGDMSIIGPRPERPQFVNELAESIRYYNLRHCVRPGLAGWAQLRYPYGASKEDASEKLVFDLFYVKNHNLLFDTLILLQTVEVVLFGRGVR